MDVSAFSVFALVALIPMALIARIPLRRFVRAVKDPAIIAFTTTSSDAALPLAMERMIEFGVPRQIVAFVMPTGYSFNLDGSTLYLGVASVFVAQAAGVELTLATQLQMMLTLLITSKGIAAVPRASLVVLAATLTTFGLPLEGIAGHRPVRHAVAAKQAGHADRDPRRPEQLRGTCGLAQPSIERRGEPDRAQAEREEPRGHEGRRASIGRSQAADVFVRDRVAGLARAADDPRSGEGGGADQPAGEEQPIPDAAHAGIVASTPEPAVQSILGAIVRGSFRASTGSRGAGDRPGRHARMVPLGGDERSRTCSRPGADAHRGEP